MNRKEVVVIIPKADKVERTNFSGTPYYSYIGMLYLECKHSTCSVVLPSKKIPYRHEEISLRWNEKNQVIEVPDYFWEEFKKCARLKKRFIVFPFGFTCDKSGHANYMIYDSKTKSIERYEPYGQTIPKQLSKCVNKKIDAMLAELFVHNLGPKLIKRYQKPLKNMGFQTLQELEEFNGIDPGYCASWSIWYADLRVLNPEVSRKKLIKEALRELKNRPELLTDFIRNYSQLLVEMSPLINRNDDTELKCIIENDTSTCKIQSSIY